MLKSQCEGASTGGSLDMLQKVSAMSHGSPVHNAHMYISFIHEDKFIIVGNFIVFISLFNSYTGAIWSVGF